MHKKFRIFTLAIALLVGMFALTALSSCGEKQMENVTVTISQKEMALEAGQSQKLTVAIDPVDAMDKDVTWESADEKIATVKDGVVTGVGEGSVMITVTSNQKRDTCKVTVKGAGESVKSPIKNPIDKANTAKKAK